MHKYMCGGGGVWWLCMWVCLGGGGMGSRKSNDLLRCILVQLSLALRSH